MDGLEATHVFIDRLPAIAGILLALSPLVRGQGFESTAARGEQGRVASSVPIAFEGLVVDADGAPAQDAVIVTSAGGEAVADPNGRYRLEIHVPAGVRSVELTAVGGAGGSEVARTSVALLAGASLARVGPLELAPATSVSTGAPRWLATFGGEPGTNLSVSALTVFDDGGGPALYAGGAFTSAGGVAANRVARWTGSTWTPLGSGMNQRVHALAVFDDGGGPALYAAGDFTRAGGVVANRIARWDGTSWTPLGSGLSGSGAGAAALAVFDDGSGDALYVGGSFTSAGGLPASRIAKWDGASWATLGAGVDGDVLALVELDGGGGPALFAGGLFTTAGGAAASRIARWDGASWTALGSGLDGAVEALAVFDDGSGAAVHAGGSFTTAGGVAANGIAKWDGANWAVLGSGPSNAALVHALTVLDDGSGPALHAGTDATVSKWDGASWTDLGSGMDGAVQALAAFDDGRGRRGGESRGPLGRRELDPYGKRDGRAGPRADGVRRRDRSRALRPEASSQPRAERP